MNSKLFVFIFAIAACGLCQVFSTSPSIVSIAPPTETTDFAAGNTITFLFDQSIKCSSNCVIYAVSNNRLSLIDVTDSMISGNSLTITPQVEEGKTYQISIPKGAIVGTNDKEFDGLADYKITVADFSEPILVDSVPKMNGEIAPSSPIQLYFNKPVFLTTTWSALLLTEDSSVAISSDQVSVNGHVLSISIEFASYTFYTLSIDANSITDKNGNNYSKKMELVFNSEDSIRPTVTLELLPIADMTDASRISDVILVIADQSSVHINTFINGGVAITSSEHVMLYTADKLTISDNKVMIANAGRYIAGETVTVDIPEGIFKDDYNNVNEHTTLSFVITQEEIKPTVTKVLTEYTFDSGIIQIQFDNMLVLGDGIVSFKDIETNEMIMSTELEVVDTVLSIHYTGLVINKKYTIVLDADCVRNIYGNSNEEATVITPIFIQSNEKPSLVLDQCIPTINQQSIGLNSTAELHFDQEVTMAIDCTVTVQSSDYRTVKFIMELVPDTIDPSHVYFFDMNGLEAYTEYDLIIPDQCFFNAYQLAMDATVIPFRTTRDEAPNPMIFNLEGQTDIKLDAIMQFTFDQELKLSEDAKIYLKPRDGDAIAREIDILEGNVITIYNQEVAHRLLSNTEYTVYIPEATICNNDNLCMDATTFMPFTTVKESATQVILQHTTPIAGAVQVDGSLPVVLHFTNTIRPCSGDDIDYIIYENNQPIYGTGKIEGQDVLMTFPLKSSHTYSYVYNPDIFCTPKGSPVRYDIGSSFSFTVADTEGPIHYAFTVNNMQNVEIRFDEPVYAGKGTLVVVNSANEQVLEPMHVTIPTPDSTLIININIQFVPDDIYTFKFSQGFVVDIMNNESPAFEEHVVFDRNPPSVKQVIQPVTPSDPILVMFSETIVFQECVIEIAKDGNQANYDMTAVSQLNATTVAIEPMNGLWAHQTTFTLTIPAACIKDTRDIMMVTSKVIEITTPAIAPLGIQGELCDPAMNSIVPMVTIHSTDIEIAFNVAVEYVNQKSVHLENEQGCILSTEAMMTIVNNTAHFGIGNTECLTGHIMLIADSGAFISVETGSYNDRSTATEPLYEFTMMPAGPMMVSATAVYKNGLQLVAGAGIDITFNEEIQLNTQEPINLSYIHFIDQYMQSVSFAKTYHAVAEGKVLHLIVDEAFDTPSASQIRVVSMIAVAPSEGITTVGKETDSAIGRVNLMRVFNLPPLISTLSIVGQPSIHPTIAIHFNQAVTSVSDTCAALLIHDNYDTMSIPVSELYRESATDYSYTPADYEVLNTDYTYHFILDQSCFEMVESKSIATGVSAPLTLQTGADTYGPVVLGLVSETEFVSFYSLSDNLIFKIAFNEPIVVKKDGFVYLQNADNEIIQLRHSDIYVDPEEPSYLVIDCKNTHIAASTSYHILLDHIVQDLSYNDMNTKVMTMGIQTPMIQPYAVEHVEVSKIQTGSILISFDAAVDSTLTTISAPDYCHYTIETVPATQPIEFDDICVDIHTTTSHRLSFILSDISSQPLSISIYAMNNQPSTQVYIATVDVSADNEAVPQPPAAPHLLAIQNSKQDDHFDYTFRVETPYANMQALLGYTFIFTPMTTVLSDDNAMIIMNVPYEPMKQDYTLTVPAVAASMQVVVKATSSVGSSAVSEAITIEDAGTVSTVPAKIDVNSIKISQETADSLYIEWAAPASREEITAYQVTLIQPARDTMTTSTSSITLSDLEDGLIIIHINAVNAIGAGESIAIQYNFKSTIHLSVVVQPGYSYAIATFSVSFTHSLVECALNAGHLIYASGESEEANQVTVVFTGLLPSMQYNGQCWASAQMNGQVSEPISITFHTTDQSEAAELTIDTFEIQSRIAATATISMNIPSIVTCMIDHADMHLSANEIRAYGQYYELTNTLSHTFMFNEFTPSEGDEAMLYCIVEDTNEHIVSDIITSDSIEVPTVYCQLPTPVYSIANGDKDVSIRPIFGFTFDRNVMVGEGSFVIENLNNGDIITIATTDFEVNANEVTIALSEALEANTQYTYYFTLDGIIMNQAGDLKLAHMLPGDIIFTTTTNMDKPTVQDTITDITVMPGDDMILPFTSPIELTQAMDVMMTAEQASVTLSSEFFTVDNQSLHIPTSYLSELTSYTMTLPECLVIDMYGHCNQEITMMITTTEDKNRPIVIATEPRDHQFVPNDVPLKLIFNEPIQLVDSSKLEVYLNKKLMTISQYDIKIDDTTVEINLDNGYSGGNMKLDKIEVKVVVKEDAFKDRAGNKNENYSFEFVAVPQRCGSTYLSNYMQNDCTCYSKDGKCYCECGKVNLFEL